MSNYDLKRNGINLDKGYYVTSKTWNFMCCVFLIIVTYFVFNICPVLKTILSRIPDQIGDRSRFLQTIKFV